MLDTVGAPASVAALLLPVGACVTFFGLFALDVHRSRTAAGPQRALLSELVFNGVMNASVGLFAVASVVGLAWRISTSLDADSLMSLAVAATLGTGGIALFVFLAKRGADLPEDAIPDFMRCDGEFVAAPGADNPLAAWCGWLRFEGHGECRLQPTAASDVSLLCTWHTHGDEMLRIALPALGPGELRRPFELFVRGSDVGLTDANLTEVVLVSLTAEGPPLCRLTFVPEEHD